MKKTINSPGWDIVWRIYSKENLAKSLVIPLLLSLIVFFIICCYSEKATILLLRSICDIILIVGPCVLGFTLSGYALMMGLSNSEFIQGMILFKEENKEHSLFQSLNATFSVVLGIMFLTTLAGSLGKILIEAEITALPLLTEFTDWINSFFLFVLIFLLFYMINSIKDIVSNIFSFGQYVQVYVSKKKKK